VTAHRLRNTDVNNNKEWVTMKIIIGFLKGLDARMWSAGTKVTLFVDKYTTHPPKTLF
jgi:hypothetical protein